MTKEKGNGSQGAGAGTANPEPKYSVESLRAHCVELFGVSSTTFNGAAAGLKGEYTVREMQEYIETWSKKEAH